ncbi:MAG TPA: substrate-binding domain-containing protein [Vicinamibacterales bacterium]|nr:substrate-binding domain-containing protein [Vicinamibacterales bacterium]
MKRAFRLRIAAMAMAFAVGATSAAADVTVLCSNGFRAVMEDLVPSFEQATTHRVSVTYGLSAELMRRIGAGAPFDLAILTPPLIDSLVSQGRVDAPSRSTLARSPIGIATRRGAAKPDLGSVESLTRSMLAAGSIGYAREGASAAFFMALVQQLFPAGSRRPAIIAADSGAAVGAAVGRGDVELGVLPVSEILPISGVEVAGTFPGPLAGYITMTAGVSARAAQPAATRALIAFLTDPAALPVIRRHGMERAR